MSIPILSSRFFQKHRPDLGFFTKYQSLFPWSDQILPVYEWKGVLYVGCLQPPNKFPQMEMQVVYVLCEHSALQSLWDDFQNGGVSAGGHKPEIPPAMQPFIEEQNFKAKKAELQEEEELELELAEPSTPEGFTFDLTSAPGAPPRKREGLDLSLDPIESLEPATAAASSAPKDSPAELFDQLEASIGLSSSEPEPEPELEAEFEAAEDDDTSTEPAATAASVGSELLEISLNSTPSISLQPLGPNPVQQPEASGDDTLKTDIASDSKRAIPTKSEVILSINPKDEITRSSITALHSGKADSIMDKIFLGMHKQFQKSMILLKSGDQMRPWKWDEGFRKSPSASQSYTLTQASPFRIVYRTQKPYHGYVAANDLNNKFFADWNNLKLPEHLTIAPIIVNDHVIGMLLGLGDKPEDSRAALQLTENLAHDLSVEIKARPDTVKVAQKTA